MHAPTHTDQDQFDELNVADFECTDRLSSSDISSVITQRSEMREVDMFAALTRQMRQQGVTVVNINLVSTTGSNAVLGHTQMPPPSRFTPRSRTAGTGQMPLAN